MRSVEFLTDAAEALPLVPGSVEDCCTRLRDRTDLPSRDAARELLTFLEALGLAAETERGYHRVRGPPNQEVLAARFEQRIFGVEEVRAVLADAGRPMTAGQIFEEIRGGIPRWERSRHRDWEAVWEERIERLLDWSVVFGLATETDDGYEAA